MHQYSDVKFAVWLATAIMSYDIYERFKNDKDISSNIFYFKQADIVKKAQSICSKKVDSARVAQWFNADHEKNNYNFLRAKEKLRRLTYINEFNGIKEYPEEINLNDIVSIEVGEVPVGEILNFVRNEYTNLILEEQSRQEYHISKINLKEIMDFLNENSGLDYKKPENIVDESLKIRMERLRLQAQNVVNQFKSIGDKFKSYGYIFDRNVASKWLDGTNTKVRKYFWIELKKPNKTNLISSISIFIEKIDYKVRYRVSLDIKDNQSKNVDYRKHHKFLKALNIATSDFEYFASRDKGLEAEIEAKGGIESYIDYLNNQLENNGKEKLQIGRTISYDEVIINSSEKILELINEYVKELEPYYDLAVKEEGDVIKMSNRELEEKNIILYGPPGTGKTYNVINKALEIIDFDRYKDLINNPLKRSEMLIEYSSLAESGQIGFCTFHQSYSYEDFVEGLRSDLNGGFIPKDGIFKQMCNKAKEIKGSIVSEYNFDETKIDFHKMSLGDKNNDDDSIFQYCIKNNCVALGWGDEIDYSSCMTRVDVKNCYATVNPDCKNEDFNIEAINRFKNLLKKGDVIIISYGNTKSRAIAKITGDYYYDPNTEIGYNHFRKVQWLYNDEVIDVKRILKEKNFSQQAIYMFRKQDLDIQSIKALVTKKSPLETHNKNYVLIIDEINRGNISKIFGELITLIESDKRIEEVNEIKVTLPYSNEKFGVPSNLYIIGTMNTADRSIALMDTALRRRFEFKEFMPNAELLSDNIEGIDLKQLLKRINERIEYLFDREHMIGHAYFIKKNISFHDIIDIMKNKVIPLLQEYFYGDWEKIELILGGAGRKGDDNFFVSKEEINLRNLFKKNIVSDYTTQYRYSINENPTKEALINIYSDSSSSEE